MLADYESATIDLKDPRVYRDLSKPIGALNPQRLRDYQLRFENWIDDSTPPFLYGTHYSSAYSVAFYLLRMAPHPSRILLSTYF